MLWKCINSAPMEGCKKGGTLIPFHDIKLGHSWWPFVSLFFPLFVRVTTRGSEVTAQNNRWLQRGRWKTRQVFTVRVALGVYPLVLGSHVLVWWNSSNPNSNPWNVLLINACIGWNSNIPNANSWNVLAINAFYWPARIMLKYQDLYRWEI